MSVYQALIDALTEKEQIRRAKLYLHELNARLVSDYKDIKSLERFISVQEKKLTSLSQNSLTTKWYSWLGNYEEKLSNEQNDFLNAWSRYKDLQESARLTQYEIDLLNIKVAREQEVEQRIAELYKKRAEEIKQSGTEKATILHDIETLLYTYQKEKTQYQEALEAGYKSTDLLKVIYQHLENALIADQRQRKNTTWNLDIARHQITMLGKQLRHFRIELADVHFNFPANPTLELETIDLKNTPAFFTSFILSNNVSKAKAQIINILRLTKATTDDLELMYERVKIEIENYQKQKDNLILSDEK